MNHSTRSKTRSHAFSDSDDAWEDIPNSSHPNGRSHRTQSPSGSVTSSTASPKKRRARQRALGANTPRKHQTSNLVAVPPLNASPFVSKTNSSRRVQSVDVGNVLKDFSLDATGYTLDVVGTAVRLLKKPFGILLFLWLLAFILARISHLIRSTFWPLCIIPGFSRICDIPDTRHTAPAGQGDVGPPRWADYPRLMQAESQTFEMLLEEVTDGPGLALEIKKAEMATSDLAALVRVSDLKSRDLLANTLGDFVSDARKAGRGLQKFSSRVGGAVDNILSVNDYALNAIEASNTKSGALSLRSIWPFSPDKAATKAVVTETFNDAMNALSANMRRLVLEAEVSLADLDRLEERLGSLHEIVSREDSTLSSEQADLLANLWTILGGNRKELRGFENHRDLLKNIGSYRKRALAHVVAALQTLQGMSEDMEDLRERVAAPELVGERIPVEVHMKSIRSGLDRLQERRIKAQERQEEIVSRVMGIGPGVSGAS
ncbi:hypothetical protein FA95DRAFT_1562541 [Auriscalpium vulgare]|uniref:Uncharacterized protein n=1 Tax=Auriscalpium vulgare TaxID=40419 RepID=A0ACB8RJQ2_9AGAM|nr:hypothetical protein FA95DRAFT_1562541 [Auriscalpium vulgare]